MITRDKSKSPAEDAAVHKKKKTGRKAYIVEYRFVGPVPEGFDYMYDYRRWRIYRRYKTEKARDEAILNLQKTAENFYSKTADKEHFWFNYEFRAGEDV